MRVVIRGSLCLHLQVHATRRVAHPNSSLDPDLMSGLPQEAQIHILRDFSLNKSPPNPSLVTGGVDQDRGVARSTLEEVHGRGAVACAEPPSGGAGGVR